METCDFCGREYDVALRRVVAMPRPSDPTELVATMWGCGRCDESSHLPFASDLVHRVETGQSVDGRHYNFVTV